MKYKPCCDRRCLLAECEIRENGGCHCCCRLHDTLYIFKNMLDGKSLYHSGICSYIPSDDIRKKIWEGLSEENKNEHLTYMEKIPGYIKEIEDKIKAMEIT